MDNMALFFLVYVVGYIFGYFTGQMVALSKVEVALQESRNRQLRDMYPNKTDKR